MKLSSEQSQLEQLLAGLNRRGPCERAQSFLSKERSLCAGEDTALWVEEADGAAVARITAQSQLEQLLAGLNRRGMRERALIAALKRRQKLLADTLSGADPGLMPDVLQQQADRCVQDTRAVLPHAHLLAQQRISCCACSGSTLTSYKDELCPAVLAMSCVVPPSVVMLRSCLRQKLTM